MFVPYICCGDPEIAFSEQLALCLEPFCDVLEIGIPFSDPLADGETIQSASQRALKNKVNQQSAFGLVKALRQKQFSKPIAFMAYYNTIYSYGREKFAFSMRECGANALIIPDLPFGEDFEFEKICKNAGVSIIRMISPSTPQERAKRIIDSSDSYFIYLVSRKGTTGADGAISGESVDFVKKISQVADGKKLCVGFGISSPGQAQAFLEAGADGVVVGSEIISIYSKFISKGKIDYPEEALLEVEKFASSIHVACRPGLL